MEIENLCRICTRNEECSPFVCIFDTTMKLDKRKMQSEQQGHQTLEETVSLVRTVAEVMAGCLDIEIKPNDQMPRRICRDCMNRLQESWDLKETYKASEKRLKQLLRSDIDTPLVKLEICLQEEPIESDLSMPVAFVDEEASSDREIVAEEQSSIAKPDSHNDLLLPEFSWKFSDLSKGHYRTRKGIDPSWEWVDVDDYRCCGCFQVFSTKASLERHCKRDHKPEPHGDESRRYECGFCWKLFTSSETLTFHQKMARSRQLFHCNLCDVLSPSKRQLNAHLKLHAPEEVASNRSKDSSSLDTAFGGALLHKSRTRKIFITFDYFTFEGYFCCDCLEYCDSKREIKRHGERTHQGNRGFNEEYSCFACLKSFQARNEFERHMLDLNARHVYYCKMCQEIFRTADKLREHQRTSAVHEGFIELDTLDVKEEVEAEERDDFPNITQAAAQVGRPRRTTSTKSRERRESPTVDDDNASEVEAVDNDEEDYEPDEQYRRRIHVQQKAVKRNDPELAEISVVDISGQDVVRCCGCYQTFITDEELTDHSNRCHRPSQQPDDKDRPYECDRCFRRFVKAVSLQIHRQFVKNVLIYSCKLCEQKFSFQTPFLLHYESHERYSGKEDKRGPKPKPSENDNKFFCCFTACKASFLEYSDLLTHVDENHGVKRNQFKDYRDTDENCCEVCFRSFSNYRGLLRHVVAQRKSNSSARHTCSTCGLQMKSLAQLKDHENKHLGIKPYECDVCQKTFGTKTILKNHMIVHQSDRPFSCEICGKTFARKRNYKDHAMTHTDEKPWECEICKLTFRIESQFLTHKRRHTGVRPYKCKFCEKVFSHATDRKRHEMAAHTGEKPHQCSFCPLAFIRKRQLVIHERTHTGEKPYECQHCGQAFIQQSYLTRHLVTHKQQPQQQRTEEPTFQ